MIFQTDSFHRKAPIFFLFVAITISLLPLVLHEGIPFGHDSCFHLSRIQAVYDALNDGIVFPGVYSEYFNGYGYGAGLFYPDFFLYIPAVFMLLGCSNVLAYKLMLIIVTFAMGISMFYCIKRISQSEYKALFGSTIYLLSSYHTTNLYIRSTIGELCVFVFIPFIILGLWEILEKQSGNWFWLCLGFSGIILSHIISSVLTLFFCAFVFVGYSTKITNFKSVLIPLLKAALATFCLTAFFTLPMIQQMIINPIWGDTGLLGDITNWAVKPYEMILALPNNFGAENTPPAGIGIILFCFLVLGIMRFRLLNRYIKVSLIFAILSLYISSTLFPWRLLGPMLQTFQFPWRMYLFITVIPAFFSGDILDTLNLDINKKKLLTLIALIIITFSFFYNSISTYNDRGIMNENPYPFFPAGCEYLPTGVNYGTLMLDSETYNPTITRINQSTITMPVNKGHSILPIIYYPGYSATLEAQNISLNKSSNGYIELDADQSGMLILSYDGTILKQVSLWFSIIALWILLIRKGLKWKRGGNDENTNAVKTTL